MKARFTIDGSDALENHLQKTCELVTSGVREIIPAERLEALLLGGGYGRGQGGVLKTPSGDKPYNDLEFYVCVKGNEVLNQQRYRRAIHHLGESLSPQAGLEVEFKVTSLARLQKVPPTMFSYDLACGHRSMLEGPALFANELQKDSSEIPLFEATRLLMNRCSGLLFAMERLQRNPFTEDDADFVGRNHAKAQLAFGDVVLAANGKYHWDCRERGQRLSSISEEQFPSPAEIQRHHRAGLEFKLHPRRADVSLELLGAGQRELSVLGSKVWLWLERKRLEINFSSTTEYALSRTDKCPETNSFRNLLVNGKTFGPSVFFEGKPLRYPRERLLESLPLLLWEPTARTDPSLLHHLQTELNTSASTVPDLVRAYENLWRKFN
ncbi:MAG: hypothetical protein ABIQ35_14630 [Verrucomicrobiota bacterium]